MARKRKRPAADYRPMTKQEIEDILVRMGPHGSDKFFDDVLAMAAALMVTDDPPPAQPLRADDAGAIADDVAAWLAGGA